MSMVSNVTNENVDKLTLQQSRSQYPWIRPSKMRQSNYVSEFQTSCHRKPEYHGRFRTNAPSEAWTKLRGSLRTKRGGWGYYTKLNISCKSMSKS